VFKHETIHMSVFVVCWTHRRGLSVIRSSTRTPTFCFSLVFTSSAFNLWNTSSRQCHSHMSVSVCEYWIYTVSQKNTFHYIFECDLSDYNNFWYAYNVSFSVNIKSIYRRHRMSRVPIGSSGNIEFWFHFVHLTYSMQLFYLGKLSKPENQELAATRLGY